VFRADKSHAIITGWQAGDDLIVNTTTLKMACFGFG